MNFHRKKLEIAVKIAIVVFAYTFIIYKFWKDDLLTQIYSSFIKIEAENFAFLVVAVFLMPLNWLVEAQKWRFILQKIEKISIKTAISGVLLGLTAGIFTPARLGEPVGRIFVLSPKNRVKGFLASSVASYSQLLATVVLGLVGLFFLLSKLSLRETGELNFISNLLLLLVIFLTFSLLFIFFNIEKVSTFLLKFSFLKKYENQIRFFEEIPRQMLKRVLALSFLRYAVFSTQFYLLLVFFSVEISALQSYVAISVTYLITSVLPSIVLADLGVRGSVSIFVFGYFVQSADAEIFMASTFLWLINLVIPAIVGGWVKWRVG